MIKNKLLLIVLVATSVLVPTAVRADRIEVEAGDRPYYAHGPRYWDREYEMVWMPGHWSRSGHRWVHGHYVRGEHRRNHGWDRGHDDRYDDRHEDYRDSR